MSERTLATVVLMFYLGMGTLGWLIAFASLGSRRYFPVLSLMGMGGGVPALGLFVIRASRMAGYGQAPNDPSQQMILIVAFAFAVACWAQALVMTIQQRRRERLRISEGC